MKYWLAIYDSGNKTEKKTEKVYKFSETFWVVKIGEIYEDFNIHNIQNARQFNYSLHKKKLNEWCEMHWLTIILGQELNVI